MINFKALDRAFDTERFVLHKQPGAQRSGGNFVCVCPHCEKPKLWVLVVDRDDIRAPSWQCFGCADSGRTALSLVRRMEDCDTFTALELIHKFQKGNEPIIDLRRLVEERLIGEIEVWSDKNERVPLPDEFIAVQSGWKRRDLPAYFTERGIGPKKALRWGLGWCEAGYFENRLVVPVTSGGEVQFFVSRYMKKNPPKGVKKVLYPKGAKPGRHLYNIDRAKTCDTIRIVEGVLDAIHVGRSAVATFGTSLSQYQLELLMRTGAREISIIWDPDAYDKAVALADRLPDLWAVRVVKLPEGKDPDEISLEELWDLEASSKRMDTYAARKSYVISRLERSV